MEFLFVVVTVLGDGVGVVTELGDPESWIVFYDGGLGLIREDSAGVAAIYNYGSWLIAVAGWTLFACIFIVIEITRGNRIG